MASGPSSTVLAALRRSVAKIDARPSAGILPFGVSAIDDRLAGRGLTVGHLHDIAPASSEPGDDAATRLFAAGIAARSMVSEGIILWAVTRFDLYAPGLEQAGLAAGSVVFVQAKDDATLLAVLEDAVRDGSPAAVVGETSNVSMTATRRLQLVAGEAGITVLLVRRWRKRGNDPLAAPSAAATRWRIGCMPSARLPVPGIGRPHWRVELVRQRGGDSHSWTLEGCDAHGRLAVPAPSRHRAGQGAGAAHPQAA